MDSVAIESTVDTDADLSYSYSVNIDVEVSLKELVLVSIQIEKLYFVSKFSSFQFFFIKFIFYIMYESLENQNQTEEISKSNNQKEEKSIFKNPLFVFLAICCVLGLSVLIWYFKFKAKDEAPAPKSASEDESEDDSEDSPSSIIEECDGVLENDICNLCNSPSEYISSTGECEICSGPGAYISSDDLCTFCPAGKQFDDETNECKANIQFRIWDNSAKIRFENIWIYRGPPITIDTTCDDECRDNISDRYNCDSDKFKNIHCKIERSNYSDWVRFDEAGIDSRTEVYNQMYYIFDNLNEHSIIIMRRTYPDDTFAQILDDGTKIDPSTGTTFWSDFGQRGRDFSVVYLNHLAQTPAATYNISLPTPNFIFYNFRRDVDIEYFEHD